jgi:flotillin
MAGFHKAGPNEALIVSGGSKLPAIKVGGRKFVMPIIQKAQSLSLEIMTLTVNTAKVYTAEGVAVSVDGVAQVKVGRGEEAIRTAAQQFLGKSPGEISDIALQTLEGQQRAILGTMTVEEIYRDRVAFATRVREVAASDMTNMGLEIVSFVVRDIQDAQGYLEALGVRRTEEVKRDAAIGQAEANRDSAIGKAEANRDSGIKEADADQKRQAARFEADTNIAQSQRDFETQKAEYDQQVNARKAEAELAYSLQEAKTRQKIREEELQIEVVERQKQIEIQEQEITRRERELDATVRRPAEAERDRLETVAEGQRRRIRVEAEAERFRLQTIAEGEKARILAEAEAEAESTRLRGQADADAIRARGLGEAEAMTRKAAAWKEYGQAAMIQQLFESLPAVASAVAMPLSKTDRITVISTGGSDADGAGASKVTRDVTNIIAQLPALLESLTGVDILGTLRDLPGIVTTQEASSQQPASGDGTTPVEPEVATPEDETAGQADS